MMMPYFGVKAMLVKPMRRVIEIHLPLIALASACCWAQQTSSGPIMISGQSGTVISNVHITSTTGNCITITNSTNITVHNADIGPCGTSSGATTGNGISIDNANGVYIYDNYIHPETLSSSCCDYHDGIYGTNGSQNVSIQGNVIAYGESNIEFNGPNSSINVVGNFLLNPRGPYPRGQNFQCWGSSPSSTCSSITVQNNYALSSTNTTVYLYPEDQEDSINFGYSNGGTVKGNFVTGGHSSSGCGIIADDTANNMQFTNNLLLNTGQCGIGIADGSNPVVSGNKIYNTNPISGAGNTALYVWKQYANPCGPTTVSNNIADEVRSDGTHSGYWDGGGCSVTLSGNTFGAAADSLLTPTTSVFVTPLVPPQPKTCVATSPYTTNTSLSSGVPLCSGTAPKPPANLTATAS
jgi:hypothetical protein